MSAGYHERVWLSWWVWTVLVVVIVASSTALLGRGNFFAFEKPPLPILYVCLLLDVIFVFVALNFRKAEIQITQEGVTVSYGIVRKQISTGEIVSCKPARMRLSLYGGVGLRLGENDLAHYKAGDAVEITAKTEKTVLIPTNRPQELSRIVNDIARS